MINPEMASNAEWKEWGKLDPHWGVASSPGRERGGVTHWTDEENRRAVGGIEARQKLQGSTGKDTEYRALMEFSDGARIAGYATVSWMRRPKLQNETDPITGRRSGFCGTTTGPGSGAGQIVHGHLPVTRGSQQRQDYGRHAVDDDVVAPSARRPLESMDSQSLPIPWAEVASIS